MKGYANGAKRRVLQGVLLLGMTLCAQLSSAATSFYLWDTASNIFGQTNNPIFQGDANYGSTRPWQVDSANNCLQDVTGNCTALPTSLFTVRDIQDIAYTGNSGNLLMLRTSQGFFAWDRTSNIFGQTSNPWFLGDANFGSQRPWFVDAANNCLRDILGNCFSLPTSLFSVSDLLDITFTGNGGNLLMLRTGQGFFAWDRASNIFGATNDPWFQADANSGSRPWMVDTANNCLRDVLGHCYGLPTNQFGVGDILDIPYTTGTMLVLAVRTEQGVPEPHTVSLLAAALAILAWVSRRQRHPVA